MIKWMPIFFIVFIFGCAQDTDLLDEQVFVQDIVEIEVREPKDPDTATENEVSIFCNASVQNVSKPESNITAMVYRDYLMNGFMESGITDDFIADILSELNSLRIAGVRAELRFSFPLKSKPDNSFDSDIFQENFQQQLSPIFSKNEDIISCVKIRFIENNN